MFSDDLLAKAQTILNSCRNRSWHLATAESCTGGLLAACLTALPGASDVVDRGFITYSNQSKHDLLGVPDDLLATAGAVSEAVARAMAEGALKAAGAQLAVSVTGIAGPGGGSPEKPVGLVHFAAAAETGLTLHRSARFDGDRAAIRMASVELVLDLLGDVLRR